MFSVIGEIWKSWAADQWFNGMSYNCKGCSCGYRCRQALITEASKRPKQEKCVEWLLSENMPPAVRTRHSALRGHAGCPAATYDLTDKKWKNMGAIRCQDSGDPPFLCLPNMVPARICILHVLIWIKCSPISIISIISDKVTHIFPLDEKLSFYWFAFFFFHVSCWNAHLRVGM